MDSTSDTIKALINEARDGTNPGRLSEIAVSLSGWYAYIAEQLDRVLVFKADRWLQIRNDDERVKSDKMADRLWDASSEGKDEIHYRVQLKYIEKVISTIKMRLRIKEGESFGRF